MELLMRSSTDDHLRYGALHSSCLARLRQLVRINL